MTPKELEKLNKWYDSKEDEAVDHYDYEYAFEHFGELLQHATGQETELARLRRVEEAARRLIDTLEVIDVGSSGVAVTINEGAQYRLEEALDSK